MTDHKSPVKLNCSCVLDVMPVSPEVGWIIAIFEKQHLNAISATCVHPVKVRILDATLNQTEQYERYSRIDL
jgi:hypothetical protein